MTSDAGFGTASHREHPTPECDYCGSTKTRPLNDSVAVCFDCDNEWYLDGGEG